MSVERRRHIFLRILMSVGLLLLLCAADFPDFAKPGPPPGQIELAQGWSLVAASDVHADGAARTKGVFGVGRPPPDDAAGETNRKERGR